MKFISILLLTLICFCGIKLLAQATNLPPGDSAAIADSASVMVSDSLAVAKTDSLFYNADEIFFQYDTEQIYLSGNTSVRYDTSTISSDSLQIDLKKDRAFSYGETVLQDNDQIIISNNVLYDVESQQGILYAGLSKMDKGFYYGTEIRKVDKNIFDVDGGRFTTCDHEEPDFWIWAKQMRLYRGDKVVGKPVIFYVNHFPVFYFPFATFSIKRGRQAGFLVPKPGYNSDDGKLVRDIAWYYPYKEYADFTLGLDLMEKTGWKGKFSTEYTKRYHFSGSSDVSYHTRISPGTTYYDWSVSANHHHELGERSSFDANINFISNKRIWESSEDIDESLAQQLTSTLSYRRPLLNSYLNVSSSYTQDLINDYVYVNLPTASFSLPTRPVHEFFIKEDTPDTWWTKFNLSYNASLSHTGRITTKERSFKDIIWDNTLDPADTTYSTYLNEHHAGIRHNAYLSYNWKLFGWLNSSQGVSYTESWADRDKDQEKWVRGNAYSASSGLSFNIYGVRNFPGYKVSSLRHILTPNVSLNYSPDQTRNSRFYGFGSIGLPSGKESTYLSLSLSQSFQAKYRAKDGTQRRLNDFVTFNSAMPIDLQKDEKQMGNISHRMSFRPPGWDVGALRLGNQDYKLSAVKMAYSADFSTSQNPYQVHWTDLDLKNKYVTQSLTISGSSPYKDYFPRRKNKLFDPYSPVDSLQNIADEIAAQESSDNWNITLSHDLYTPSYLFDPTANNLRLNSTLKLTTNWSSTYSAYYSLKTKELLSQSFSLSRKLHCWQIDISYTRRNEFWEYSIVFFNTTLPESLKFETKDSRKY